LAFSGCFTATLPVPIQGAENLDHAFAQPPADARPWVNWFWLDGNITREGITADLEAMQRVGLGGALLMDVTQDIPPGPVRFGTPQWHEMFRHAASESKRLGLVLSLNNAPGWSGSGGPWITPDLAMQKLVWSKTNVSGPAHFDDVLPSAPSMLGSYHDVAILAFPPSWEMAPRFLDLLRESPQQSRSICRSQVARSRSFDLCFPAIGVTTKTTVHPG